MIYEETKDPDILEVIKEAMEWVLIKLYVTVSVNFNSQQTSAKITQEICR